MCCVCQVSGYLFENYLDLGCTVPRCVVVVLRCVVVGGGLRPVRSKYTVFIVQLVGLWGVNKR